MYPNGVNAVFVFGIVKNTSLKVEAVVIILILI